MLVSHRYRFIFIKTKKTAGTSLEIALSRFMGPRDIITHITPEDEAIRESLGYPGPRNYFIPYYRYRPEDWRRYYETGQRLYYYNHMAAEDIRCFVGRRIWDSYYKFCFERNPWDKMISWYYWEHRQEPRPSLEKFVASGRAEELAGPGGRDLYTINGVTAVNDVFLYEKLDEAVSWLSGHLGLPQRPELPRAKSGIRQDRRNYQDIYGPERESVAAAFRQQIRDFGYSF